MKQITPAHNYNYSIILIGMTGQGKSSLINAIFGMSVSKVGEFEPTTPEIEFYRFTGNDSVNFTIVDTPGLTANTIEQNRTYYESLKTSQSYCLLFVTALGNTRIRAEEKQMIKEISQIMDNSVWKKAIVILTFADQVSADKYSIYLHGRTRVIRDAIRQLSAIEDEVVNNIPFVATTALSEVIPNGEQWRKILVSKITEKMLTSQQSVIKGKTSSSLRTVEMLADALGVGLELLETLEDEEN